VSTDSARLSEPHEVTVLLEAVRAGDASAESRLLALIYPDLKRIAHRHLRGRGRGETLQTTALVHEAYLRLAGTSLARLRDRVHFLAVASRAMRHILVDRARSRVTDKRGGNAAKSALDLGQAAAPARGEALLALDGALAELERLEPRLGRVVEMRFFGGMTAEETGTVLGLSDRTIKADWRKARAFLSSRLASEGWTPKAEGPPASYAAD
jgi:RNA polymerase sigma factor (TIGR02999 family)